ncbi:hypothetical protein GLA29479_1985 [Lysobacter antibioticus]|nr:hypothetical protein GLA29479_1985 [Lysobacter antibioticus]
MAAPHPRGLDQVVTGGWRNGETARAPMPRDTALRLSVRAPGRSPGLRAEAVRDRTGSPVPRLPVSEHSGVVRCVYSLTVAGAAPD